ncbi:unnamed protein product [Effrenium voratum]|nr:unnamed protein product [Effrenium voratum]
MVLRAYFPAGLGISENVGSRQDTQSFRTRPCDPPHLLNSLRLSDDGETLYFSWSQPAEVAEPGAKISLCRAGGATRCFLEKTVADPEVTPCITGPDSCSEWSLDVRGLKACGQLSLQVEAGAVRALTHPLSSFAGLAQMTHPVPCGSGSLAYDEVPKLRCLELTDPVVLVPGQSNANFHGDLLATHVVLQAADTRGAFLAALRKGPHTTPCAIVPKVAMKFWSGEERMIFEYVRKGGQLYSIGGHQNRALLEVFGLTAAHGHSGNLQFLQDMGGEADRKAEKCGFLPKLPVLNSMSSVKLGADARAHHFGQVVRGKGLYAAEETYSEYNSFGVVEVEVGHGVLDYFAFDWFDEVQEDRRPWAMQFALLAQCNAEHRPHVSAAPAQPQAWPGAPGAGAAAPSAVAAAAAYPVAAGGQPFAPDQQPSADQYAQYAQPGRLLAEKEEHPELKALDAWEAASPVTGDPVEPDLEISIAMPCELQGEPNCEKVRQTMVQQLLEGSAFYETLQDGGIQLELSHFAPPHVIRVLSRCPPLEDIAEGLLYMNAACDFGAEGQDRFTSSTAFLRKHLIQSRLGVEVLTKELRHQVCRSPLCRGHVLHLRKKLEGCEDLGHEVHAASVSRIVGAVALGMESCLEVHSVVQGDATHGEVAGESGRAVGVWSSDMSEVNVVRLQGLDTGSPAEMRAVEHGARQILAKELKLPFFAFEERGGSFADVFDPLLGGPNVFVQDRNLRVAAQLTPLVSSEPFDEAVGLLEGEDLPIHQSPMYETQHNLQMLALQPAWGQQNVDPSSLRLRVIFEEIVTKDDLSAVIRVFPKALREICLSLQADDPLQWQRFPTQTGLGDLEPADGAQDPRDVESLPVGFLCHTISAGDESRVLASGEVLQLELRHPLLRNTEYVVQLPPRVVKAAMGSTRFPGALWAGWPADEGQGNKEYVFSTGLPLASNARLALAVSCGSEKECRRARKLLSETGMADLALRAKCYALWWRCHQDPIAPKHCERPSEMSWCDVGGSWSPSWAPPREEEEEEELSGVADQAVSEMQSITLPSWVYILALVAWVQGTFATLRGAWWVADLYVQSRDFDPFVAQGTRSLPLKVCAVAMGLPLLTGLLGALLAAPLFRLTARDNWRSGLGGSSAMVEAGRLHEQLAASFTATICVSEACLAVLSYSVIARFKSWVADKGQLLAIFTLCCAGAGAAGSACGWVGASDLHQMNDPSEGLAWDVFVLLLSAGMAQTLSLALMPCAIFLLLCETPGIGDILSYALKFQAFQWRQWFEHGTGQGLWSEFVLLIADIEVDEGFISNMLDMGMDDGHLFIKFYCSATPHDVSATRSHAVRWEGDQSGAQTFDGEDIFVNFQDPLTLLRVDVMFQEETASRPECVATTIWDPWVTPLLDKYFENFKLCDARANHGSFWNPKDLFHSDGRPLDGVFLQLELNLTRHRTECIPEMGSLRFRATHLGGFGGARKSRSEPGVKPERLMALGDTIHGRDNIFNRRPIVEVQKCDFYDGKFRRSVEEEEEERKRMAHRQQLRHQLLHETSSPMSPHSVRSPQSQIYSPASSPLSMSPVSQMRQPLTGDTRDPRYPGGPMAGPPSPLPMRQSPRWVSPGASPARTLEPAPAVQSPASRSQGRREEGGQGLGDWLNDTLDSLGL